MTHKGIPPKFAIGMASATGKAERKRGEKESGKWMNFAFTLVVALVVVSVLAVLGAAAAYANLIAK